jgi:hypothetical protein
MDVIRECSEAWDKLITGKTPSGGISTYGSLLPCLGTRLLTLG